MLEGLKLYGFIGCVVSPMICTVGMMLTERVFLAKMLGREDEGKSEPTPSRKNVGNLCYYGGIAAFLACLALFALS